MSWLPQPVAYRYFPLYWQRERRGARGSCLRSSGVFDRTCWVFPFSSLRSSALIVAISILLPQAFADLVERLL